MKNEKVFSVAGTAKNADGTVKVRFANDLVARIKILNKSSCTDINLVELPRSMSKLEALKYLTEAGFVTGDAGFAVATKMAEKTKVAKKGEVKVTGKGVTVTAAAKPKAKSTTQAAVELMAAVAK